MCNTGDSLTDGSCARTPYPAHGQVITVHLYEAGKNSCLVSYQHGNYYGSAYANIKKNIEYYGDPDLWPTNSTTFPPASKRFGWGWPYQQISPRPTGDEYCHWVKATVWYVPPGGTCCYSNSAFSASYTDWIQALGTGNIVASEGRVLPYDFTEAGYSAAQTYSGV